MGDFRIQFSIQHRTLVCECLHSPYGLSIKWIFTSRCSLHCKYSVIFLLIFNPRSSIDLLHSSSFLSACSLVVLHCTISSANNIHQGGCSLLTGKDEPNLPKQKDGARAVKCERPRRMCPWSDGMRRRRMCPWSDGMRRRGMRCSSRHANTSCRRDDTFSMYRRCRRGPWSQSRYAPWAAFSGDCCQQAAPTGWGECQYPSPFFAPFACNWSGESNADPDTGHQKQDGDQPTPEECCQFFKGAPAWFRRHGGCCSGRRWQGGPSRNKIYKMLTRRRNMVKEKLQRIESMLENMQPSEEEATETTVGGDASPQPAAAQTETDPGKTNTDREWDMIADSE